MQYRDGDLVAGKTAGGAVAPVNRVSIGGVLPRFHGQLG
jgi:hypothetical protein